MCIRSRASYLGIILTKLIGCNEVDKISIATHISQVISIYKWIFSSKIMRNKENKKIYAKS